MNKNFNSIAGHVSAVFTVCVWGTTFIATKLLLNYFTAVEIMFYRFLIAFILLFLMCPKILKYRNIKEEIIFASAGLLGISLYQLCENSALMFTYASNVSFITTVAPFFTAVFSMLFLKTAKAGWKFYLGFAVALSGVFLISFSGAPDFNLSPAGDALALAAAVLWGGYSVVVKVISRFGYNIIQSTAKIFFYALIFIIPELFIFKSSWNFAAFSRPEVLGYILFLGVLASCVCFVTWNFSIKSIGASKTSVYIYLLPAVTVVFSLMFLDEKITLPVAFGMLLTVTGLIISQYGKTGADV